jgi:ParB/RepB/Spo0J family partition protein
MSGSLADKIKQKRQGSGAAVSTKPPAGRHDHPEKPTAPTSAAPRQDQDAVVLSCSQIVVQDQARKNFANLEGLAESIQEQGQLQPVIVTPLPDGQYLLAYGERRLRAIRDILKHDTILARIKRDIKGAIALRLSQVAENIQREDYDPFELANEFARFINDDGMTQSQLSKKLGVTQGWISKKLSILSAPKDVQEKIQRGELAEFVYYNQKDVEATPQKKTKGKDAGEPQETAERVKTISVPRNQVIEVAKLIRDVTIKYGLSEVELSKKPTKSELLAVLSRIKDVKGAILK